jgi:hypothetical protein
MQPMIALASSRGKQIAAQVGDEITGVTASPYLSGVFGATSAASFWKRDKISNLPAAFYRWVYFGANEATDRRGAGPRTA